MLTIAILSSIGLVTGVLWDGYYEDGPRPRTMLSVICIIAWWDICYTAAIVILVLSVIWFTWSLVAKYDD
jgi:hypothetical protein